MAKYDFNKIFAWMPWISLLVLAGWLGLFVIDWLELGTRDVGVLVVLFILMIFTFAVESLMRENPDLARKYFIHWIIFSGLFVFFGLTIYIWVL